MAAHSFMEIVLLASVLAGFIGSLTGLGGGIVVTPVLTLLMGVDMRYAIGASLISVIATSSGAAAAYVRDGLSNVRIGMFLEMATTIGAISGALIASKLPTSVLAVMFGAVLLHAAWQATQEKKATGAAAVSDPFADKLQLRGEYCTPKGATPYAVVHAKAGFSLMYVAGLISGLLGIGSGALKVIAMDRVMKLPFKVSTATSSFMIGVTAVASAGIYLRRGYVQPVIAVPVMLGVLAGSMGGARLLPKLPVQLLRRLFAVVVAIIAVQMIVQGLRGRI